MLLEDQVEVKMDSSGYLIRAYHMENDDKKQIGVTQTYKMYKWS